MLMEKARKEIVEYGKKISYIKSYERNRRNLSVLIEKLDIWL